MFFHLLAGAFFTPILPAGFARSYRISIFTQDDDSSTLRAFGRFIGRWVRQLFKIVLIRSIPNAHLRLKGSAVGTVFPIARVLLCMMIPAEGITAMVPAATVACVREEHIFVLIVAYPILAAFSLCQIPSLAAQTTGGSLS